MMEDSDVERMKGRRKEQFSLLEATKHDDNRSIEKDKKRRRAEQYDIIHEK